MKLLREVHEDCRAFVAVVEELLERRRHEMQSQAQMPMLLADQDWGPRKWHRTELEDTVYSSYKRMRQGHITRPPRREVVMEIADYLNCTLSERNRLLVAAQATTVEPYLTGSPLQHLVTTLSEIAAYLPIPTMIINRDWRIHHVNDHLLRLYGLTAEQLGALPQARWNVLSLLFDPALPLYPFITAHRPSWRQMALQTLYGFKMANVLCQYEPWYHHVIGQHRPLPDFGDLWQQVDVDSPQTASHSRAGVVLQTSLPSLHDATPYIALRPVTLSISYFQYTFPQIIGFFPADEFARQTYRAIGIPFPDHDADTASGHFVL